MKENYTEQEMYPPIRDFLTDQGYLVYGEVKGCDIAAIKGEELVLIEMKRSFQLKLVYQAIERQKNYAYVYVAIPRPETGQRTGNWKDMLSLLKRLEIGLITVAMQSEKKWVEVILTPGMARKTRSGKKERDLRGELAGRSGDYNQGGSVRKKIVTAFRERCIELACFLEQEKDTSLKQLRLFGFDTKVFSILNRNVYGWFERKERGIYGLSEKGKELLEGTEFSELISYYRQKVKERKKIEQ